MHKPPLCFSGVLSLICDARVDRLLHCGCWVCGVLLVPAGAFENTVQALYKYVVPKPREQCSKTEQLTVSFAAGYIAGVFCAIVSHPADNLVSKLNAQKGATAGDIVKQMGWYALFTRGLGLRIIMIGTLTGLQVGGGAAILIWMRLFISDCRLKHGIHQVHAMFSWLPVGGIESKL